MEFLKFVRLDIISILLLLFVVIRSCLKNQKKVWRNLFCLIFAIAIVGIPLYFDVGGIFTKAYTFLNTNLFPLVNKVLKADDVTKLYPFLGLLVALAAIGIVELLLVAICGMIGGSDRRKYARNPSYATVHHPVGGAIAGIFRSAILIYLLFITMTYLGEYIGQDITTDFISNLIKTIDPIVEGIRKILMSSLA